MVSTIGKLTARDETTAGLLKWLPWFSFFLVTLPAPIVFLWFFATALAPDSAAFYLLLVLLSFGISALVGIAILLLLIVYRRRWYGRLRDRLSEDGITADEVRWFTPELTSAERQALKDIQQHNPLLADAYCETLASRLTATRIMARVRGDQLKVERRINQARALTGADTRKLLDDLEVDHERLEKLKREASSRLAESRTQLQMIEAAASRTLNQRETDSMLRRLATSQDHLPLSIEMANMERQALREAEIEADSTQPKVTP